jgi:spore maturation protein CgeB
MKIVTFAHSLASCWNHGNAHFLRGLLRELVRRGHDVVAFERADGWSRHNLVRDHGQSPLARFAALFPELTALHYTDGADVSAMLDGADLAIVHEWTDPELVRAIGAVRKRSGKFLLLFHDTHHRAVSDAAAFGSFDLSGYDGVLAFGASLAEVYRRRGWGNRVFVFHEAADVSTFSPPAEEGAEARRRGLVWIGNWGDEERSEELHTYLLRPARDAGLSLDVYGVRYPDAARQALGTHGARYHGWVANTDVPSVFGRHLATVHVPRRPYTQALPGIPTIRVFEALACGIPLVSAPWRDEEGLFRPGRDFLLASSEEDMRAKLRALAADPDLRAALAASGLARIRELHTCAHRADELLAIAASLAPHQLARGAA